MITLASSPRHSNQTTIFLPSPLVSCLPVLSAPRPPRLSPQLLHETQVTTTKTLPTLTASLLILPRTTTRPMTISANRIRSQRNSPHKLQNIIILDHPIALMALREHQIRPQSPSLPG